jgi:hypothetical protein
MRFRVFGFELTNQTGITTLTEKDLDRIVRRDRVVEVEEIQKDLLKFRAIIPVLDLGWEGRNVENVSIHGVGLAKQLARSARLHHLPQTHDLQTKDGMMATYGIAFRPQNFHNSERFFFIRKNILQALLQKHGFALIWAVWGERELSYKQMERARPDGDLSGLSHADFQAVYRF